MSYKQFIQGLNALCLYCNESVNRLKLRELGGLQFFVTILSSSKPAHQSVHKKLLEALIRFGYDSISMKVKFCKSFLISTSTLIRIQLIVSCLQLYLKLSPSSMTLSYYRENEAIIIEVWICLASY